MQTLVKAALGNGENAREDVSQTVMGMGSVSRDLMVGKTGSPDCI